MSYYPEENCVNIFKIIEKCLYSVSRGDVLRGLGAGDGEVRGQPLGGGARPQERDQEVGEWERENREPWDL